MRQFLYAISVVFLYGLLVGFKQFFPFGVMRETYHLAKHVERPSSFILENCSLQETKQVPSGATAYIGHSYGSPRKNNEFIADKVLRFLINNLYLLDAAILTGDVFSDPSDQKWQRLNQLDGGSKILVAPGNHDVVGPGLRESFERSVYGQIEYPKITKTNFGELVLEDSIVTSWKVSNETLAHLSKSKSETTIIARHNVPIKELLPYSNSREGVSGDLDTLRSLHDKTKGGDGQYIWIIGDGGAFPSLSRLECFSHGNHKFLINGIGEVDGDSIILEHQGQLYVYRLNN